MKEKENIRNAPFLMNIKACRHYNVPRTKLSIEIEIANEEEKLILSSSGIFRGRLGNHFHGYNNRGREYFEKLIPNFGKIRVLIHNEKPISFDNYEEFLDEITSD